jgi:type I restriction enzyme M protein
VITGEIKSRIDRIWDTMWSGGVANPLSVIEQLTYLLFIKRLDDLHTLRENKAARLKQPIEDPLFLDKPNPASRAEPKRSFQALRWSRFKDFAPEEMFEVVRDEVFPFIKSLGAAEGSTYSQHMRDAIFTMPSPRVLTQVVDQLADIPMADRDTKGDVYEYMLGKIASAGQNGQFRTPRHIIQLIVALMAPTPADSICDPASGTCGFLVAAAEYLRQQHGDAIFASTASRKRFNEETFHGYDFDATMLRIGSMNMLLHGVENPDIRYKDSLEQAHAGDTEAYSLILANPPFAGSLDYESTAKDLLQVVKTKKTELLFLALFLRLLKVGGRAAVIVPDGVLFGSSKAHKQLRQTLVEEHRLEAVISLPSGTFKPYAGVSTGILIFTKTHSGGTSDVFFYDIQADGWSLDDKRNPLLAEDKLGPTAQLSAEEHGKNNLPDTLAKWQQFRSGSTFPDRTQQCFTVPKAAIAAQGYDLSLNRYKEVVHETVQHRPVQDILLSLEQMEAQITEGTAALKRLLAS